MCNSFHVYKDGLRRLSNGKAIQRFLCRDCGYRFSRRALPKISSKKALNSHNRLIYGSQVGDSTEGSKNLAITENPPKNGLAGATRQNDAVAKGKIVEFSFWLLKRGYAETTIKTRVKLLNRLLRLGANFEDEESVKEIIATQKWSINRKVNAVDAYSSFLQMQGKKWTPPMYKRVRKLPFIPTEIELDRLIASCSKRVSTYLQMLKETGMRCGEASNLKWTDIDLEQRSVRVTPEKGSNPRILPISVKLVDMLNEITMNADTLFGVSSDLMRRNFAKQRKRITAKLKNQRIKQITFHTFRHWKATMEYHKTRDILHVKEILGHKSLDNTMLYTQLISFKDNEFTANVAHSEEEACKLVEAGFEYVCDFDRNKIFRKRK